VQGIPARQQGALHGPERPRAAISSLEEGRIVFMSNGVEENVDIVSGFVEIAYNKVTVCAEL
jgi:F0F1-type ATP synthase epsilon subunit